MEGDVNDVKLKLATVKLIIQDDKIIDFTFLVITTDFLLIDGHW